MNPWQKASPGGSSDGVGDGDASSSDGDGEGVDPFAGLSFEDDPVAPAGYGEARS